MTDNGNYKYIYFWYCHGMSHTTIECIQDAIDLQDWGSFNEYRNKFGKSNLPDTIFVIDKTNGDCKNIPLNEENFKMITYAEYENG